MSKLLINEPPLQVLPSLACKIGLNEAIVLQQVHYWLNNKKVGRRDDQGVKWVRNSVDEWQENFPFWSKPTIKRAIKSLESQSVLLSTAALNRSNIDRTKWYTIDYTRLEDLIKPDSSPEGIKMTQSARRDQNDPPEGIKMTPPRDQNDPTNTRDYSIDYKTEREQPAEKLDSDPPIPESEMPPPTFTNPDNRIGPRPEDHPDYSPAVMVYRSEYGRMPPRSVWKHVKARVGGDAENLRKWEEVCRRWNLAGYNPSNLQGQFDWYESGIPEYKRPESKSEPSTIGGEMWSKRNWGPPPEEVKRLAAKLRLEDEKQGRPGMDLRPSPDELRAAGIS